MQIKAKRRYQYTPTRMIKRKIKISKFQKIVCEDVQQLDLSLKRFWEEYKLVQPCWNNIGLYLQITFGSIYKR